MFELRPMFPPTGTLWFCFCILLSGLYEMCLNARWNLYWHFCHTDVHKIVLHQNYLQSTLVNKLKHTPISYTVLPENHSSVMVGQLFLFFFPNLFMCICTSCIFSKLHVYDQVARSLHCHLMNKTCEVIMLCSTCLGTVLNIRIALKSLL